MLRIPRVQRDAAAAPQLQREDGRAKPPLLGKEGGKARVPPLKLVQHGLRLLGQRRVEEPGELHLRQGGKETRLDVGVFVQELESRRGPRLLGAVFHEKSGVLPLDGEALEVFLLRRILPDLHAAELLQLAQQLLPVAPHGKQAKLFHLHDGHQPFTTLPTM